MELLNIIHGVMLGGLKLLTIPPQRIGLLPMDGVVPDVDVLVTEPERHDQPDQIADDWGNDDVDDDYERDASQLDSHLAEPSTNSAVPGKFLKTEFIKG